MLILTGLMTATATIFCILLSAHYAHDVSVLYQVNYAYIFRLAVNIFTMA